MKHAIKLLLRHTSSALLRLLIYYPLQNTISSLPIHTFMVISMFKAMPSKNFDRVFENMYIINLHVQEAQL